VIFLTFDELKEAAKKQLVFIDQGDDEPKVLTRDEILKDYQRAFNLINDKVFDGELTAILIDYLELEPGEHLPERFDDADAAFFTTKEGQPFIILQFHENPQFGLSPESIEILWHEMIHYYCYLNGIEDTTQQRDYHNIKFKEAAETHGGNYSQKEPDPVRGYTDVKLNKNLTESIYALLCGNTI
jgi:hypothetical protein